jgi:hypothetical protein
MKLIVSLFCFFTCVTAAAQVEIIPAIDSSLFVGIDNRVVVKSGTIPLKELKLSSSSGTVTGSNGNYIIRCSATASNALLKVLHKNKVVATKKINVNRSGDPNAFVVGESLFSNGTILKKQLDELRTVIVKCDPPLLKFQVVSFTAAIIHNGESKGSMNNSSDAISLEVKRYLKYAVPGDEIIFDTIKVITDTDLHPKQVPMIRLKVI